MRWHDRRLAVLGGVAALALSGCGGSSRTAVNVPTVGGATNTVATVTQTVTTTTAPTTNTQTTPPGGRQCVAADLTLGFIGSNGAMGHIVLSFSLRNRSSTSCHTYGYPGIQFYEHSGAVPTHPARTTRDFAGSLPETRVSLGPGAEASFRLVISDVPSQGSTCANADAVQIIAPDDTASLRVQIPSISECGKTTVSPVQPGRGAAAS